MHRLTFRAAAVAALAFTASCGNEPTAPAQETIDEALEQIASIDELTGGATLLLGGVVLPPTSEPSGCAYSATTKRFVCASVTTSGITTARYYQLLNAAGAPLGTWSLDVVAIRSVTDRSGTITGNVGGLAFTIEIDDHDEATLSGIRTSTRTLTGESTTSWTQTTPHETRTYLGERTALLTFPSEGYPTGTVTMALSANGDPPASVATITYDGTSIVTLTATLGAQTVQCTMNLQTPSAPANCAP